MKVELVFAIFWIFWSFSIMTDLLPGEIDILMLGWHCSNPRTLDIGESQRLFLSEEPLSFCLSMMMFLLLCFIWSQKKSLTQTGENLLCFTFKLWLLSASDSASINLCCLREIVSTSLTFRFQQLEYQVFPFKYLFWSCTCSRNKKLVHWNPSPTPLPSLLPLNLSWMQWPTGKGLLRF